MAVKRVTMQDIADACGLSRNTVSKVFNGRGAVPEVTRRMIMKKAQELGYGQLPDDMPEETESSRNVALLTQHKLLSHNFGAFFITSFTDTVCRSGYNMKMYEVSPEEIKAKRLPPHLDLDDTAALLCIELFDKAYLDMVVALGLPCVFVDGFAHAGRSIMTCDYVAMENYAAVIAMTERMIAAGAKRIGFVGDKEHCNSFSERWVGYSGAMGLAELPVDPSLSILDPDGPEYGDDEWLLKKLQAMPVIPDGFVCANDYLAIHLMRALKRLGLRIPEDVMVTGFDGSPEAAVIEPKLTTAQINSTEIGRVAAVFLLDRILNPQKPFRRTVEISPVSWGGTTR